MPHEHPPNLPEMICARCGVALDYEQFDESQPEGRWVHPYAQTLYGDAQVRSPADLHEPQPVTADQAPVKPKYRCDFCFAQDPAWRYPCRSFDLPNTPGYASYEDWAACDKCHDVIEKQDIDMLVRRAMKHSPSIKNRESAASRVLRRALKELYLNFFRSRNGDAVRSKS